ncbi:hypothetical protein [Aureimonas leprariae]|uniref:hypothetical protein n=1 Tax=Plantimonas leprariae TaxID=2615207 RepID=UPI0013866EAA|nr:hypothetical protein [Aureimonas leprariae]
MSIAILAVFIGIGLVALSLPAVPSTPLSGLGDMKLGLRVLGAGLLMFGVYGWLWLLLR